MNAVSRTRTAPRTLALVAAALSLATMPTRAHALTLQVGPGRTYTTVADAIAAAGDGDVIEVDAGRYAGEFATIHANDLTIRGIGGFAHLDASGTTLSNGKAIWVQQGNNLTLENIEMSGASVPDQNGAGVRVEADGLTVRHCYFHHNENGILGGDGASDEILIEDSEFADNGFGDGYSHNIYIGRALSLTVRGSWFHHAHVGHELKSRASINILLGNRFSNEDGDASYEVDLPEGGVAILVGNVIQQGENTGNSTIVSFAEENQMWPIQELYVVNNTVVNDRVRGATFVRYGGTPAVVLRNNLFVGAGMVLSGSGGSVTMEGNLNMASFPFADAANYDYHLLAGSPAIDVGVDPGTGDGRSLMPAIQYLHPAASEARSVVGSAIDVGSFEFGNVAGTMDAGTPTDAGATGDDAGTTRDSGASGSDASTPGDGSVTADDASTTTTTSGGCGCRASASGSGTSAGWLGALLLLGLAWRRRRSPSAQRRN